MKRVCPFALAAVLAFAIGCSGPLPPTPAAMSSIVTESAPATPGITSWSCLAQRVAGTRGIFGSGMQPAACPSQSRVASLVSGTLGAAAAPASLTSSVNGGTVTLTWVLPASPDPATSYVIEAGSSTGASNLANFNTGSTATTYSVTDVPPGTYFVRVRSASGLSSSSPSNEVVVTVGGGSCVAPPSAPGGLTASVSGSSLSLSWTAPVSGCAPTGYVVEAGTTAGLSNLANVNTGSTATTFSAQDVPPGTYFVRVRAANGFSASAASNEVTVIVGSGPPPPTLVTRWVGVAPEGMIVTQNPQGQCPGEYDLQLDLTSKGTVVTGAALTRLRKTIGAVCGDVLGEIAAWSVINLRLGSDTISFDLGGTGIIHFDGTYTDARMTGTFVITQPGTTQTGSFAVNRQ